MAGNPIQLGVGWDRVRNAVLKIESIKGNIVRATPTSVTINETKRGAGENSTGDGRVIVRLDSAFAAGGAYDATVLEENSDDFDSGSSTWSMSDIGSATDGESVLAFNPDEMGESTHALTADSTPRPAFLLPKWTDEDPPRRCVLLASGGGTITSACA